MYSKIAKRCDLTTLHRFLAAYLTPENYTAIWDAIHAPLAIPTEFGKPNDPGSNHDHVAMGCLRSELHRGAGNNDLAKNASDYAAAWMGCYRSNARDSAHRYLEGPLYWLDLATAYGKDQDASLGREVVAGQGRMTLENDLIRNNQAGRANVRVVTRTYANVAVYVDYLRRYQSGAKGLETAEVDRALAEIIKSLDYLYSIESRTNLHTSPNPGEHPGWAVDDNGIPYQVDREEKTEYEWQRTGNVWHKPFTAFSIQHAALFTVNDLLRDDLPQSTRDLIDRRKEELEHWFWKRGYVRHENPMHTGTGWTRPLEILRKTEPWEVGKPNQVNDDVEVGHMLYPYWRYLYRIDADRYDEYTGGMLNAFVAQTKRAWSSMLGVRAFSPSLLEAADKWARRNPEPDPDPPTGGGPSDLDLGKLAGKLQGFADDLAELADDIETLAEKLKQAPSKEADGNDDE